jgi:hypothetical protein
MKPVLHSFETGQAQTKEENYKSISLMNIDTKISIKHVQTKFKNTIKICTMIKLDSFQRCKDGSIHIN